MLKIAYHSMYCHPLPSGHRFPMVKYELIPAQLKHEGVITDENLFVPEALKDEVILLTHDALYLDKLKTLALSPKEIRKTGFPLSKQLVEREIVIAGGTVQACMYALEYGATLNVAGGTHHAYKSHGEGFCLLNDQAIAANYLLDRGLASRILIVDLDVHQGNGTAKLFEDRPEVFTFSMHGADNYPLYKERSDLDIALPTGSGDGAYLALLADHLPQLITEYRPDFAFYLSGVDVLATDSLGKLNLTPEGCRQRDSFVLNTLHKASLPVVICMGGGYSPKVSDIVAAHCHTFKLAYEIYF